MVKKRSDFRATKLGALEDLPNVGPAIAGDLRRIGIQRPLQLRRRNAYALYARLNRVTAVRHDPCVLDTCISAVRFVDGGPPLPWWKYTAERKKALARGQPRRKR
jgi:hypothetical protein